ncbi:MAG: TraR/DksA C4-type zinc finger protein [Deltaproteobacteria bacterium]|nr:TraR/DksA C4-type zinc finger protein [Deltaproteobacteria bacterium]
MSLLIRSMLIPMSINADIFFATSGQTLQTYYLFFDQQVVINEIFARLLWLESDWQVLKERDIESEEEAQKADETSLFDQDEIEDIDLALCRVAAGSYGICESCEKLISLKRLEALPATLLCRRCARRYGEKQKKLPRAREVITCAELPDEYKNLTNEELQMVILEHLRNS